jgi:acetylornithine deacetylase/succinyl-diaminopimelate desuccinylase-like protein
VTLYEFTDDFLAADADRQQMFLAELVKVPSDNPPGDCAPHARRAAELLRGLGLEVEEHPVPAAEVAAVGMKTATNLVVRHRFGDGPVVALNAHGDVVPPGLGWRHDPYGAEVENSPAGPVMFGRGVAVSKSDFATYTWALLALQRAAKAGADLKGTLELHFTYDEEVGGDIGPKWLIDRGISKPDFVIAAGFAYNIVNAHNGCLHLEVVVTGKQAHAAMPHTGVDALEAATAILSRLYASREALTKIRARVSGIESPTLNVGLISGGINTNVVPDRITFRLDRRIVPGEDPALVEAGLRSLITATPVRSGISVAINRVLLALPLEPQAGWEKVAGAIRRHAKDVMGIEASVDAVPLYTDARHYAAAGIPTVLYGAGPRTLLEANGHNADENLRLNDLKAATNVVTRAIADLLSG